MKITVLLLLSFMSLCSHEQDLKNTEWVKIKVERIDGSKLVDNHEPEDASLKYFFTKDSVFVSSDHQYANELPYSVDGKILSVGNFAKYKIDSLSDISLFISQLSNNNVPDNKLNRYFLIKADYIFDYLRQNKKLNLIGDSLIECNNEFSPTYTGNFYKLFSEKFNPVTGTKLMKGNFIVSPDGKIKMVNIDSNHHFSQKEIDRVKNIIYSSAGSWIVPPTPAPVQFKMTFAFRLLEGPFHGTFTTFNFFPSNHHILTIEQREEADRHFDKGVRFFNKEKFEEAAKEFNFCITIDNLDIDAWYNLGSTYEKLGNKEKACETWKHLSDMGQKTGEALYHQSCK